MTVLGEAPGGTLIGVRPKDRAVGEALRRLTDMVEAMEETPGLPSGIAQDGVYALARAYGEALSAFVRQSGRNIAPSARLTVVHELRPDSSDGRTARIIARVGGSSTDHGGHAELPALEGTVPLLKLRGRGRDPVNVVEIVRDAVLAAAPELSSVTAIFGAAPSCVVEPPEAPMARAGTAAARR